MDKKTLDEKLVVWIAELPQKDKKSLITHLDKLKSIYPFNEYEYRLMYLFDKKIITFTEYESLRDSYVNSNPYLYLYNLSPRVFGEIEIPQKIIDIDVRFKKPSKKFDKKYDGEYDLFLENGNKIIKIEIKACRAINSKIRGGLETKALSFGSKEPNWMNFQQIKLGIADIFIFVGVWTDKMLFWILTNKQAKDHPLLSHQHRGGVEFQIGITDKNINEFKKFLVEPGRLVEEIKAKIKK